MTSKKDIHSETIAKVFSIKEIGIRSLKLKKMLEDEKGLSEEEIEFIKSHLEMLRDYSVSIIQSVKEGRENSFEELMEIKDMRNFLHHYAYHIRKYHYFRYTEDEVIFEMLYQIFHHVSKNYRIYNEPHEISLLIMSMRNWIRLKVSSSLNKQHRPKVDEQFENLVFEQSETDLSQVLVDDILLRVLSEEEEKVVRMRVFEKMTYSEIGETIGASKDTAQRRWEKARLKIKKHLESDRFEF